MANLAEYTITITGSNAVLRMPNGDPMATFTAFTASRMTFTALLASVQSLGRGVIFNLVHNTSDPRVLSSELVVDYFQKLVGVRFPMVGDVVRIVGTKAGRTGIDGVETDVALEEGTLLQVVGYLTGGRVRVQPISSNGWPFITWEDLVLKVEDDEDNFVDRIFEGKICEAHLKKYAEEAGLIARYVTRASDGYYYASATDRNHQNPKIFRISIDMGEIEVL